VRKTARRSTCTNPTEVQYWTKHLKVSKEQLQKAVDKVGNAAAAVRKELAA